MKKIIIGIVVLTTTTALMAGIDSATCIACHGADWSKSPDRKAKPVSEMTHAEIATALKGYKTGDCGRPMNRMQGQALKYSDAELDAFAQTIGK
ncbi:cytochrome C [Candidatus Sulfurimonas marisnigri]|uniref:Cytochrome C n=1 Tax=Candidatus Sulfurimonas marisnigri TaxID=2740405 RepID=A0A7S7M2N4_9BACT|nr:cytochrome C [Candidatus Sulfurimonas marisnigri]QOY55144.1 cytochrome C [Candidatus Sulfurimonas marisnigri]